LENLFELFYIHAARAIGVTSHEYAAKAFRSLEKMID
jgi:hypothetical protein